jgi:sec-independent protein translocase protein TatA
MVNKAAKRFSICIGIFWQEMIYRVFNPHYLITLQLIFRRKAMFGGISVWQLLILLVVVILIFGTKKLRTLGGDLGGAVKGFKKAMNTEEKELDKEAGKIEDQKKDAQFSESVKEDNKNKS